MNVVGRVGTLISQGVYSVATPFHPFGGAVDVIVVKQQDGTFRSTPWYVRFGKFQGVLKGAEKVVRINVNGVEANFHMYLDNSGEAYFIKEVESSKGSEGNGSIKDSDSVVLPNEDGSVGINDIGDNGVVGICRLEHSVSDSGVVQLREESESLGVGRLERAESDADRRYYDFQDEQSSLDGSVELPEYDSKRYDSLDGENIPESQGPDSEVILVSVDGHVLTAPVLASEQNTENVQLCTPQFHLGPGDDTEEFNSGDDAWAANYISKLSASASNVESASDNACSASSHANVHQLEVCEGDGEHACQSQEVQDIPTLEGDVLVQSDSDTSHMINRDDIFKSCSALPELDEQVGNANFEDKDSSLEVQKDLNESPRSPPSAYQTTNGGVKLIDNGLSPPCNSDSTELHGSPTSQVELETIEKNALSTEHMGSESMTVHSAGVGNDPEQKDGEGFDSSLLGPVNEGHSSKSTIMEQQNTASFEEKQTCSSSRFEISLCGKELHAGMGLDAAAKIFEAHRVSIEEFRSSTTPIIKNEALIIRYGERYFPWEKAAPIVLGMAAFGLDFPVESKEAIAVEQDYTPEPREDDDDDNNTGMSSAPSSRRWRLWPIPFRRVKTIEHTSSNSSNEEFVDTESGIQSSIVESTSESKGGSESPHKQFIRTNVPTSEQIESLNLKDGQNNITFSFSTRVWGTQQVDAHIYLWKWNARIVISDVDGTITKSDVLGQFMPLVGRDWTQSGVAGLFSAIKENGYQLLFLSARAIVQAYLTRSFLFNVKQDGKTLPYGPVVISPDGLFPSLYREVIRRAPHEFKIACLEDIRRLFPPDYNPFYAGFGNRDTDELSYRKIGIPKGKIFIINPKGEVAISHHRVDVKSYTSLHTLVNDMFPPTSLVEQEDYNSWNFWKVPLPEIES